MDEPDPRNLIGDAYAMGGISPAECRSVFLDWLLGLPADADQKTAIRVVVDRHAAEAPDHPMTAILCEGLSDPPRLRRRGRRLRT